jgi:hypothetical protein
MLSVKASIWCCQPTYVGDLEVSRFDHPERTPPRAQLAPRTCALCAAISITDDGALCTKMACRTSSWTNFNLVSPVTAEW